MELVHGELITDGDSSTLTVLVLYISGSVTVRTLKSTEFLNISDLFIQLEDGGDYSLVANSAAAGRYIRHGNAAENGGVDHTYEIPYKCPRGIVPKFKGAATGLNVCIIEGFITEG